MVKIKAVIKTTSSVEEWIRDYNKRYGEISKLSIVSTINNGYVIYPLDEKGGYIEGEYYSIRDGASYILIH